MGWADAPVVAKKPAWEAAPVVSAPKPVSAAPPTNPDPEAGVLESALTGITGMVAKPVSDIMGLAAAAKDYFTKNPDGDPAGFKKYIQDSLTYEPRSASGKAINQFLGEHVGAPIANAISSGVNAVTPNDADLTRAGLKEAAAQGLNFAGLKLPEVGSLVDSTISRAIPTEVPAPARPIGSIPDDPVAAMRAAGIKLSPTAAGNAEGGGAVAPGTAAEKFAGSGKLNRDLAKQNQPTFTRLGAQDAGLPADVPRITPKALDDQAAPHIQTYADVGQTLGKFEPSPALTKELDAISQKQGLTPTARSSIAADVDQYRADQMSGPDMVKTISALRRRSAKELQSDDVNTQDLGAAHRQIADAYENELARQASLGPEPELAQNLQNARTALAKIHDVESITRAGQVDPQMALRLRQKGIPLSGNLKIIADAAEYGAPVARHIQSIGAEEAAPSPFGLLNPVMDVATGGLRPLVRKILSSNAFQNTMGKAAESLPADARLGDYFKPQTPAAETPPPAVEVPPTPASAMLEAQRRAGGLQLAPEPVLNAQRFEAPPPLLHAEVPPATPTNGVPFTRSQPTLADLLSGDLSLAPEGRYGSLPGGQSPRAAGMSEYVPGTTLHPELRAVRSAPSEQATPNSALALANNASGESAASAEAISRVAQEKANGQGRYLIDRDGSIRPLTGVDAVDANAKPGQIIVQKNVGANEYTILDRGGLSKQLANGTLARAMQQLKNQHNGKD